MVMAAKMDAQFAIIREEMKMELSLMSGGTNIEKGFVSSEEKKW